MVELKRHPAPFSKPVLDLGAKLIAIETRKLAKASEYYVPYKVLDPMAGTGRIHELRQLAHEHEAVWSVNTKGIELEAEWASYDPRTECGDSLKLLKQARFRGKYNCVFTSPTYGNRMADHHNAQDGSERRSYTHYIGRTLSDNNSGVLYFGLAYQQFHQELYDLMFASLREGGMVLLNVSDFYRDKAVVEAVMWHKKALKQAGFTGIKSHGVATRRYRYGQNSAARVAQEVILQGWT